MGEAWSDWYAMDYLVDTGQLTDTRRRRRVCGSATTSVAARI